MNNVNDFLGIAVVGSALSLLIQWLKQKFGTDSTKTKALTIGLAIVVGGVYTFLQGTTYWTTILGILGAASTVYALFLK